MTMFIRGLVLLAGALAVAACADEDGDSLRGGPGGPGDNVAVDADAGGDPVKVSCTTRGAVHTGFGKTDLNADRVEAQAGADRARIKPYSALKTEVPRVTGQNPSSLDSASGTFGSPQDRWFSEPISGALTVSTTYSVAFQACLGMTKTAADYAAAPNATSAPKVCATLARKFWSRTPAPEEIDACAQVAITDAASDPDPRRRWAYACASALSASGFMAY